MEIIRISETAAMPVESPSSRTQGASAAVSLPKTPAVRQDKAQISQQALSEYQQKQKTRAETVKSWITSSADLLEQIRQSNEQAESQAESQADRFEEQNNCRKIAANIMKGSRISAKDLQYLLKHDGKLYQMAMSLRKLTKDAKDSDPVIKDEDGKADSVSATGSTDSADAAAVSGGEAVPDAAVESIDTEA